VGKNSADLETARSERREIVKTVPADLLASYDFISRNKQGIALAEVTGEACSGCYISLPPQLINEIRRGDKIIRCTSCARILYM
jgi:predicted  nucleic acid-binding Zn-ribbon protein